MLDKMIEDLLEEPVVDNNEIVFTSRAVELIHEISEKCKGIQIVEQTREQAEEYGHSMQREFAFLIVHSMLHLFGYDHMEEQEAAVMEEKQREILECLNILR